MTKRFSRLSTVAKVICVALWAVAFANECAARDGAPRTSAYTPNIDPIFAFSAPRTRSIPTPNCKGSEDANQEFYAGGKKVSVLIWPQSTSFLQRAYAGTLGFEGRIANVDHVVVVEEADDRFRVYMGSAKIIPGQTIYCGFQQSNYLNKEWADAGFQNKDLFEQLPEYTEWEKTVMGLSAAYEGADYARTRSSLLARGFTPIDLHRKSVELCGPGLESICQKYSEAACDVEFAQGKCIFEWLSSDGKQLEVSADVTELPDNVNETHVTSVEIPQRANRADDASVGDSPEAMNDWKSLVADAIQKKADESPHDHKGSHVVYFSVEADGKVGNARTLGGEGGDADLANAAVAIVDSIGQLPPPPNRKAASFSIKITFE